MNNNNMDETSALKGDYEEEEEEEEGILVEDGDYEGAKAYWRESFRKSYAKQKNDPAFMERRREISRKSYHKIKSKNKSKQDALEEDRLNRTVVIPRTTEETSLAECGQGVSRAFSELATKATSKLKSTSGNTNGLSVLEYGKSVGDGLFDFADKFTDTVRVVHKETLSAHKEPHDNRPTASQIHEETLIPHEKREGPPPETETETDPAIVLGPEVYDNLQYTAHAEQRMNQRGLSEVEIRRAVRFGKKVLNPGHPATYKIVNGDLVVVLAKEDNRVVTSYSAGKRAAESATKSESATKLRKKSWHSIEEAPDVKELRALLAAKTEENALLSEQLQTQRRRSSQAQEELRQMQEVRQTERRRAAMLSELMHRVLRQTERRFAEEVQQMERRLETERDRVVARWKAARNAERSRADRERRRADEERRRADEERRRADATVAHPE